MRNPKSPISLIRPMAAAMFLGGMLALSCLALPEPATGGKGGGPLDLLLIKGHSEWSFGTQPELDATYQQMLKDLGYRVTVMHEWQKLTPEFLRQFNSVAYLNPSACWGGGYFDLVSWRSGVHMLTIRDNLELLRTYIHDEGGGVLFIPTLEEMGVRVAESLNVILGPYGLKTTAAAVRDPANHWVPSDPKKDGQPLMTGFVPVMFSWTDRMADHPVAQGVKRIYYPGLCTRWDDNYTTIPLKPVDPAWTVIAQGMPGSVSEVRRSPIYDNEGEWNVVRGWNEPAIAVAREYGKGRVAVVSVSSWYLFYLTYSKDVANVTESAFGKFDGVVMSEGDGQTKSDMHVLLDNAYRWLAESSLAAGMGGYDAAAGVQLDPVDHSLDNFMVSDVWPDTGKDPLITGPVRAMRVLVGARSAVSSGKGTPADWAAAAKVAGYDVVCFTETLEDLKHGQWEQYAKECRDLTDDTIALLPGFDVGTDLDNRFLIVGHFEPVREHLLTPDLKKMFWTGHMMIGMGDTLPCPKRPAWLNEVRGEFGRLPPDLYSHVSGIPVKTYAYTGGKQEEMDDGMFAYLWQVRNASLPFPIVVHEVDAPEQLATAAASGLQSYVNSDTAANAVYYYRQGFVNYGGNPARYYVSDGPLADTYAIDDWQAPAWTVTLKAHSDAPITEILVHDQFRFYRRFTPNTPEVAVSWNGDQALQRWFTAEIIDANGGRAWVTQVSNLPQRSFRRCMDRQNFFGCRMDWLVYIGMRGSAAGYMANVEVPGVTLAAPLCYKPQMSHAGYQITFLDYLVDETYVPGGTHFDGSKDEYVPGGRRSRYDNAPVYNSLPIPEYWARERHIQYRQRDYLANIAPAIYVESEVDIRLKKDLQAQGDVWPVIGRTVPNASYAYTDPQSGQRITGAIEGVVDLPAGGTAHDVVALTPLRVAQDGRIGFPPAGGTAKAGTTYHAELSRIDPAKAEAIHTAMGLKGPTPYSFSLAQGRVDKILACVHFAADNNGVAGSIKGASMVPWAPAQRGFNPNVPFGVPLRLHGANPRWAAGLWTATGEDTGTPGAIEPYGFDGDVLLGSMLTGQDTEFYFGNLVTASNPDLNLAFASEWTADTARIEVNNPTDKEITATIATAPAVKDKKQVSEKVTVPAGATVYVEAK